MYDIMKHIHNFFIWERVEGEWIIEDGSIDLPFLVDGQYFIMEGSRYNDYKVFKYGTDELEDEEFTGYVLALDVPSSFVQLCTEIKAFIAKPENNSAFTSESFGGYSYTKATGTNGAPLSWQGVFKERLNIWRKV